MTQKKTTESQLSFKTMELFVAKKGRDVKVGDVIMVAENEYFPVDLIILRTSADNVCYIETKNLDGETNLKHKQAP